MVGSEIHAPNTALQETAEHQPLMCALKMRGTGPRFSFPCLLLHTRCSLFLKWREWEEQTHTYIWFILLHTSVHGEKILSWKKKHPGDLGPGADLIKPWVVFTLREPQFRSLERIPALPSTSLLWWLACECLRDQSRGLLNVSELNTRPSWMERRKGVVKTEAGGRKEGS